jgi:glycolate oxidase iron-sulfur subunit
MQRVARGHADVTDPGVSVHFDRCLGCRACETVCPSGVIYGPALEAIRAQLAEQRRPPLAARIVLAVIADPHIRTAAMAISRLFRPLARFIAGTGRLGFMAGMVAATRPPRPPLARHAPDGSAPAPEPRGDATVFTGCIMQGLFSHVHAATRRTLAANGYAMVDAPDQQCCGALHAHAGLEETARALARQNVRAFADRPEAAIAVNSAGCGAMLRQYGALLADDPLARSAAQMADRVRDVSELLADAGPLPGGPLEIAIAYDPPCHLMHAQRVVDPPERVLAAIPSARRIPFPEPDQCCGSAGIYSLTESAMSRQVLARKLDALQSAKPDVIVTGNPGCIMQIGAGLLAEGSKVRVYHPVEVLDWSYRIAGFYDRES